MPKSIPGGFRPLNFMRKLVVRGGAELRLCSNDGALGRLWVPLLATDTGLALRTWPALPAQLLVSLCHRSEDADCGQGGRRAGAQEPEPSERVSPSCNAAEGRPSGTETSGATGPTGGLDCPLVAIAASGAACGRAGGCCSVVLASIVTCIVSVWRRTERARRRNRLGRGEQGGV